MMVKTERKAMGKSNKIKNTDRNGILLALEKDLEFIREFEKLTTKFTYYHNQKSKTKKFLKIGHFGIKFYSKEDCVNHKKYIEYKNITHFSYDDKLTKVTLHLQTEIESI